MNKKYFYFLISLTFLSNIYAQGVKEPLVIGANSNTTVTLFFPNSIEKVIPPSVNYKFDFEAGGSIGLLKARKGNTSNLTVITSKGDVYSFLLKYSEKIEKFNYIINPNSSVGKTKLSSNDKETLEQENDVVKQISDSNLEEEQTPTDITFQTVDLKKKKEKSVVQNQNQEEYFKQENTKDLPEDPVYESDLYESDKEEYFRVFCENNYLQKSIYKRSFRQSKKILVRLNNILIDRDEMYFMVSLENTSKKEYNVHGLSFFLKDSKNAKAVIKKPIYTFNLQKVIDPESNNEVVYVFKKFALESKQILEIVLDEKEGNRMVILPLDIKYLNLVAK
ncbi:DUF4138 domain-containing protein [uncultured Maribacter sp.]|uniref:DUF4138 domain-containing protein n=1 Tax=uncultured Maribacter sp. TaxID=431308 RepID=UPI002636D6B4|nr:DUF4138 domain-containing protein [uncultured Maribacter sp.]